MVAHVQTRPHLYKEFFVHNFKQCWNKALWLQLVRWLTTSNHSALFHHSVVTIYTTQICLWQLLTFESVSLYYILYLFNFIFCYFHSVTLSYFYSPLTWTLHLFILHAHLICMVILYVHLTCRYLYHLHHLRLSFKRI